MGCGVKPPDWIGGSGLGLGLLSKKENSYVEYVTIGNVAEETNKLLQNLTNSYSGL